MEPNSGKVSERHTRVSPSLQQRLAAFLSERDSLLPVWVRAPVSGPEHYSGLTRAKLYQLAGERRIRSVSIREPGTVRGCRLFNLPSIFRFIEEAEAAALNAVEEVQESESPALSEREVP